MGGNYAKYAKICIYAAYSCICSRIFQHFSCPVFIKVSYIFLAAEYDQYLQSDIQEIEVENV